MNLCLPWLLGWQGYFLLTRLSGHITKEPSLSERGAGKESAVPGRGRHRTACEQPMGLAALLPALSLLATVTCGMQASQVGGGFFYVGSLPWAVH